MYFEPCGFGQIVVSLPIRLSTQIEGIYILKTIITIPEHVSPACPMFGYFGPLWFLSEPGGRMAEEQEQQEQQREVHNLVTPCPISQVDPPMVSSHGPRIRNPFTAIMIPEMTPPKQGSRSSGPCKEGRGPY